MQKSCPSLKLLIVNLDAAPYILTPQMQHFSEFFGSFVQDFTP